MKKPTTRCQQPSKLEIDEYYGGAWNRSTLSGCIPLSPASTISGYLTLGKADRGYKYRLRVDYYPGCSRPSTTVSDSRIALTCRTRPERLPKRLRETAEEAAHDVSCGGVFLVKDFHVASGGGEVAVAQSVANLFNVHALIN